MHWSPIATNGGWVIQDVDIFGNVRHMSNAGLHLLHFAVIKTSQIVEGVKIVTGETSERDCDPGTLGTGKIKVPCRITIT